MRFEVVSLLLGVVTRVFLLSHEVGYNKENLNSLNFEAYFAISITSTLI